MLAIVEEYCNCSNLDASLPHKILEQYSYVCVVPTTVSADLLGCRKSIRLLLVYNLDCRKAVYGDAHAVNGGDLPKRIRK
jgi:hypothetical protein